MKKEFTLTVFLSLIVLGNLLAQNGPQLRRIEGQGNGGMILEFAQYMHDSILNSPSSIYNFPLYENNMGPVYVDIYNPTLTPSGNFLIVFNDTTFDAVGNDILDSSSKWYLVHIPTNDTVFGDSTIASNYTQDISQWGMKIRTKPTDNPGTSFYTNNGFLTASMSFANPALDWLTGLSDNDFIINQNWIRSGTSSPLDFGGIDDYEIFENIINGTWAPYRLCAFSATDLSYRGGPAWNKFNSLTQMRNLASVDVVFTSDKSKWTRCPVLEMQDEAFISFGNAIKHNMRKSQSVDKNGLKVGDAGYNAAEGDFGGTQPFGMGWFPGYALNLETGERLNMAFGEDSYFTLENGADMVWNPTSTIDVSNAIFGSKHYVYVFGHNGDLTYTGDPYMGNGLKNIPVYDQGVAMYELLKAAELSSGSLSDSYKRQVYADAMWVNIPLLKPGHNLLETDVTIKLRVSKKYRQQNIANTNNTNPKYLFNKNTLVGINSVYKSEQNFLLYPNPASTELNIEYKLARNAYITIYNAIGEKLKEIKLETENTKINIADLPCGLYIIKLNDGIYSSSQRFIKQ